jgi:hypothetical protein
METGGRTTWSRHAVRKMVRIALLCLVIGSLFGGLVGVVMSGETGFEPGITVITDK